MGVEKTIKLINEKVRHRRKLVNRGYDSGKAVDLGCEVMDILRQERENLPVEFVLETVEKVTIEMPPCLYSNVDGEWAVSGNVHGVDGVADEYWQKNIRKAVNFYLDKDVDV
ncbi:hypothetical protein KY333_05600 [Candidatus Woesearchaeota archaeon]|nr:hypothetical protein [Candidatus Woesearchaeota archaeon]MBW2994279.1 hypothetical protein [Candidatus Woesearchaeota archaeon]